MAIEFNLPEVSEGVTSVDIAEIHVAEGDVIEAGKIICEVETDKAVAEIPCPHAGRIAKLLVSSGDTVDVGQLLLVIEAEETAPAAPAQPPVQPEPAAAEQPEVASEPPPAATASAATESAEVQFCLPEVSEGVTQVDIAAFNLAVGDSVNKGDIVCEVETDKAVAEIPCPHAGTVTAVHTQTGATLAVGAPLITSNCSRREIRSGCSCGCSCGCSLQACTSAGRAPREYAPTGTQYTANGPRDLFRKSSQK